MRRLVTALLLGATLLGSAGPALATARQTNPIQECLDQTTPEEIQENGIPSCREENGRFVPYWNTTHAVGLGAGFVVFMLLIVVLWVAVPIVVAYSMASSSGQSTGIAVLLAVLLGWIGVLVVYLMGRSDTRAYAHGAVDALGPRPPSPPPGYGFPPSPPPPASPAEGPEARLAVLDRLRESGQISDDEYATRRQTILDSI